MNPRSEIRYRGKVVAYPVRRADGRWQAETRMDKARFGPIWQDTPEGWDAAKVWLEGTGHEIIDP